MVLIPHIVATTNSKPSAGMSDFLINFSDTDTTAHASNITAATDGITGRFSTKRSSAMNTTGNVATESLPASASKKRTNEKMYHRIGEEPARRYFRYANREGSANAVATRSFLLAIHAMASTCTGC